MPRIDEDVVKQPEEIREERTERLALNLHDLDRLPGEVRKKLLTGRISDTVVWPHGDKEPEHVAVVLTCPIIIGAMLCDVLRGKDREAGREETRIYLEDEGTWEELTKDAVLSYSHAGKVLLNPDIFPPNVIELHPPRLSKIEF